MINCGENTGNVIFFDSVCEQVIYEDYVVAAKQIAPAINTGYY